MILSVERRILNDLSGVYTAEGRSIMCLLKVYVEEDNDRKLVAQDVVLISKEGESIKMRGVDFEEKTLTNVNFFSIDALNSVLIFKKGNGS